MITIITDIQSEPVFFLTKQKENNDYRYTYTYLFLSGQESVLASMLMRPWPVTAISTASFEGDDERLNRIKRVFIKTERDHMLDPQQQDSMIKKWPPSEVLEIDTDHSPFFSAPEQLFNLIVKSL